MIRTGNTEGSTEGVTPKGARPGVLSLPLVSSPEMEGQRPVATPLGWHGFTPVEAILEGPDSAEPMEPQGAYGPEGSDGPPLSAPRSDRQASRPVELLAPAGGLDAAFAAFHFGADA